MNEFFDQPVTLADLKAMTLTATAELGCRWMDEIPAAREYLRAGWGLSIEAVLVPTPALMLHVVDSDGARYPIGQLELAAPPLT